MTNKSPKPVKQCDGCALNLGERCAAFAHPHEQWRQQDCVGYNDEELLKKHGLKLDNQGAHARKAERKEKAKYDETVEHEDGNHKIKKR